MDICDVALSVSTPGKLKGLLNAVGIEHATFGLLVRCSTNYEVKSV